MRYMRWSYDQLCACPKDYVEVIVKEAKEEAREAERHRRKR